MTAEHTLRIGGRTVILVEGPAGWGECSPLPGYPCPIEHARASAREAAVIGWPDRVRDTVPVNALVTRDRIDDAALAGELAGFDTVKVKVGDGPPEVDIARLARVRDLIGPSIRLRVDANGAWDVETAVHVLDRVAHLDLEFVEQPVTTLEDLAAVRRRVAVPIAADESVRSVADADRLHAIGAADVVVLKVQPLGGVRAALAVADASGVPAVVTSMMETSVGLAAGLALACSLPELQYACGLATIDQIDADVVATPLRARQGHLTVPAQFPPVPSPELLARYAVAA